MAGAAVDEDVSVPGSKGGGGGGARLKGVLFALGLSLSFATSIASTSTTTRILSLMCTSAYLCHDLHDVQNRHGVLVDVGVDCALSGSAGTVVAHVAHWAADHSKVEEDVHQLDKFVHGGVTAKGLCRCDPVSCPIFSHIDSNTGNCPSSPQNIACIATAGALALLQQRPQGKLSPVNGVQIELGQYELTQLVIASEYL